ncbi:hypothetical protein [Janthinobacterium kumbetense]|uniref:Uncharacterized protein n=1 Tax=Janthinobacterium kumbetense TaxID=2950280 RepID=A0ABT0WS56_9BURK|nr:hypothetical protein [Janthinobacterium kumbetense]MCM2566891.1 hypothetical protein [Janthinobacterium kumbetense]
MLEFRASAGAEAQGEMTLTSMAPGPDDRLRAGPVTRLRPMGMGRYALGDASGAQEVIDIVEATPDVLRLSRR